MVLAAPQKVFRARRRDAAIIFALRTNTSAIYLKQTTIPALKPPSPHRYFSIKNEKLQAVDELKRQQEFAKVTERRLHLLHF